jgi:hypothetical protein
MHDAADNAPIVRSFDTSHIRRQTRLDASIAHRLAKKGSCASSDPSNESNPHGIRIVLPQQQN